MKSFLLLTAFLLCCKQEKKVTEERDIKPPIQTGTFVVRVFDAADLYAEPSFSAKKLARIAVDQEVQTFSDLRTVIDTLKPRPVNLVLVKFGRVSGWLNSNYLGYRDSHAAESKIFRGALSNFKYGCIMAESTAETYKSCGNCGTLDFFPWGGFAGTLGCDDHLNGRWYIQSDVIHVEAEGKTMCNHFMGTDPSNDKNYMKKCLEFQAQSHKIYKFHILKKNEKWTIEPQIELGGQDPALQLYSY